MSDFLTKRQEEVRAARQERAKTLVLAQHRPGCPCPRCKYRRRSETDLESRTILDLMDETGQFDSRSWDLWKVALKAVFALPMTMEELRLVERFTGRLNPPKQQAREALFLAGRRGGKTMIGAVTAVHMATRRFWDDETVGPGNVALVSVIAATKDQARTFMRYTKGLCESSRRLSNMVVKATKNSITLNNRCVIEVLTRSYRTVRGYTLIAAVAEELAFWRVEEGSADIDSEVIGALRPALSGIPGSMLLMLTSPYMKVGVAWQAFKDGWGKDDTGGPYSPWVWRARTLEMRPGNPALIADIQEAFKKDPVRASCEFDCEFRDDTGGFLTRPQLEKCVVRGRSSLDPEPGKRYVAFFDAADGAEGGDSMALAIAEVGGRPRLCEVLEQPAPFKPWQVIERFCQTLDRYKVSEVQGDNRALPWVSEEFGKRAKVFKKADLTKSDLYLSVLPLITGEECELLDRQDYVDQLVRLRRAPRQGGGDFVSDQGLKDDCANVVAGALTLAYVRASTKSQALVTSFTKSYGRVSEQWDPYVTHPHEAPEPVSPPGRHYSDYAHLRVCAEPGCQSKAHHNAAEKARIAKEDAERRQREMKHAGVAA